MPKTVWINPTYRGIESFGYREDYEACFSVDDKAGFVNRYKKILFEAYTIEGKKISKEIEGFLARVLQHEVDHLRGTLFIDLIKDPKKVFSFEELKHVREERRNSDQKKTANNAKQEEL